MRKFLSLFLAAVLVLSSLCLPAVAAETDADGYTLISTWDEFKAMSKTGKSRLACNIVAPEGTTINVSTKDKGALFAGTFKGEVDGAGYSIDFSNAEITWSQPGSLFYTTFAGSWKNITLTGLDINYTSTVSGQSGIIAYSGPQGGVASASPVLENVHVSGAVTATETINAANFGGYIGVLNGAQSSSISFTNCSSNWNISTAKNFRFGGYVGAARTTVATATLNFTNCETSGTISVGSANAGGFVLEAKDTININAVNCVNAANITGATVGGFVAVGTVTADKDYTSTRSFTNCINLGDLTGTNQTGGIVGMQPSGGNVAYNFDGCVNAGTIASSAHRAGGIIAHVAGGGSVTIKNCINFANVSCAATEAVVEAHSTPWIFDAAAIIVYCDPTLTISNCVNFGTVTEWTYTQETVVDPETSEETKLTDATQVVGASMYDEKWCARETVENLVNFEDKENQATSAALDSALLHVLSGARIRLAKNDQVDSGLRYDIATNAALLAKLSETYTIKVGSQFAAAATLGEATSFMGLSGKISTKSQALADVAVKADGTYAAALIGFKAEQYTTNFVAGGFITLTVDGTTYTIYSLAGDARSISTVANAALEDDTVDYTGYETILNTFAGK